MRISNACKAAENAVAEKRNSDTNSANTLENKANKEYNEDVSYSLKWHPDLSKNDLIELMNEIKYDIRNSKNAITDKANWLFTDIGEKDVFAIYSTEDYKDPTLLYESKGKKANIEKNILMDLLEEIENGRNIVEVSKDINTLLSGDWVQEKHNLANNDDRPRRGGSNTGYASVLQGKPSEFIGSKAFRNVIRNLFNIQERDGELNKSHSLKDSEGKKCYILCAIEVSF